MPLRPKMISSRFHPTEVRSRGRKPAPAGLAVPEARYPLLLGCDPRRLVGLRKLRVAVVGVGSIGMRIALHLARMGIALLVVIDPKRFKPESLLTHEAGPADLGEPKAGVVARRCQEISPATQVFAFVGPVEALEADALAEVDLVIMAPDRLSVEVELAQRCLHLGIPLLQASVHGETLTAQVRLYENANAPGGCAGCYLGRDEWEQLSRQVRYSCEGAANNSNPAQAAPTRAEDAPVTASFSSLCSLAADLAVHQVVRFVLHLGEPVSNTLLEYCGFTHRTIVTRLGRNPRCPLDHFSYRRVALAEPLGRRSLAALACAALGEAAGEATLFEVTGMDWVEMGSCRCSRPTPVRQFLLHQVGEAFRCPQCAAPVVPLQFYTHRQVSAARLGAALEKPLHKLGAGRVQSVWVRTAETGALVTQSARKSSKP
jgi:molybdopterin/thiamine biosynthesis adenylyltransferase